MIAHSKLLKPGQKKFLKGGFEIRQNERLAVSRQTIALQTLQQKQKQSGKKLDFNHQQTMD
jgi:hypothetical protein